MGQAVIEARCRRPGNSIPGRGFSAGKRPVVRASFSCNPRDGRQRATCARKCSHPGLSRAPPPRSADAMARPMAAQGFANVTAARAASLAALMSPPRPHIVAHWSGSGP